MKTCKQCLEVKPFEQFYVLPHTKDGYNYRCITCQNAYNRAHSRRKALAKIDPVVISTFKNVPLEFERAFLKRVQILPTGCWKWTGSCHPDNEYGRFWISAHASRQAHRLGFLWSGRDVPDDLVLDHLCRNRWCVNPDHLEPVTLVENVMRGESIWAQNARKTHCLRGHEFTAENTWISKNNERHCRECSRIRKREARARRRLAGAS